MDEKQQFARRLRDAMVAAGHEARPSVLEKHFNARYWGRSVSYQAARRWLIGLSISEQEKLQVIAEWLNVPPHVLRFGVRLPVLAAPARFPSLPDKAEVEDQLERDTIERFLSLPANDRRLIAELVAALARPDPKRRVKAPAK